LSSIVVHYLQKRFERQNAAVLYLYLNHEEKETQTLANLFGSLLKQLIEQQGPVVVSAEVRELYQKSRKESRPQVKDIYEVFKSSLSIFKRVFIVVDALNESHEDIQVRLSSQLDEVRSSKVSLMVTQRAESDRLKVGCNICGRQPIKIYYHCRTCANGDFDLCQSCKAEGKHCYDTSHEISELNTTGEIDIRIPNVEMEHYVSWEINNELKAGTAGSSDPRFGNAVPRTRFGRICYENPELIKEIPEKIVPKANGMILLVRLYMDALKVKQNRQQIEDTLDSLPEEFDSNYDQIMERIDSQSRDDSLLARRVLSWIVYTHRPLGFVELQHALAVSLGDTEFNSASIFHKDLLLTVTAGLVRVDTDGFAVRLSHFTAYEYFYKNREKYFSSAAADIARVTLTYLSFRSLSEPCQGIHEDEEFAARLKARPFLSYASEYWGEHVREAGSVSTVQDAVLQFVSDSSRLTSTIQAYWYLDMTGSSGWDVRKGVNSLHVCSWFGLDAAVRELVTRGVDIDSQDEPYHQTALMYACRRGHASIVRILLELGAWVNIRSARESTPLFEAVDGCHLHVVKVLLEREELLVNSTQPHKLNRTALMLAVGARLPDIVDALLERQDIDVNQKDEEGFTALSVAAMVGDDFIVESILYKRDREGRKIVNIDSVNRVGSSALILAAGRDHETIVWQLLECGADPLITDGKGGGTAIQRAVDNGQVDVVQMLLGYKADVQSLDSSGRSLLNSASLNGSSTLVQFLVEKGLDPDFQDQRGRTPLHDAARTGKIDVTKALLNLGANRSLQDRHGRTPHAVARQHGHRRIMLILEGKEDITDDEVAKLGPIPDADNLPVWSLAKLGMKNLVEKAIAQRDSTIRDKDPDSNDTAVHWAVSSKNTDILQLLLETTDICPDAVNDYLRTPLHLAAVHSNFLAATILLSQGAVSLDLPDAWAQTPLLIAQANKAFPLATALIAAGAFIDTRKILVQPLFFAAVELGSADVVEKLILAGADVLAKNALGETGLRIAKENGNKEVERLLLRKKSFYVPMRSYSERSRESASVRSGDSSVGSTPSVTPGATPAVSPRLEVGGRRGSFAFRPRPGQVGGG